MFRFRFHVPVLLFSLQSLLYGVQIQGKRRDRSVEIDKKHPTTDPHSSTMAQQVEELFRKHTYEMSVSPAQNDEPVRVGVAILIESISDISEVNMDLTFTLRIWKTWTDARLNLVGDDESIVLPSRLIDMLWVPDLFIVGSKKSFLHHTTVANIMLRLYKNGTINYRAKITTTVACQMNLYNFPLDIENCTLAIQSLAYTDDEVVLEWLLSDDMDNLFMDPKLVSNMPKFRLVHHRLHTNTVAARQGGGQVSQLGISLELQRYLLSVFFQSYFPAIMMVILAGMGMWLDPRSVPARVAMGITSVLTISTIITGLKSSLPKVSYLTAMDIYLWTCFMFVFITVLEYCVLNYVMTLQFRQEQLDFKPGRSIRKNGLNSSITKKNGLTKRKSYSSARESFLGENEEDLSQHHNNVSSFLGRQESTQFTSPRKTMSAGAKNPDTLQTSRINLGTCAKVDFYFKISYFLCFILFNAVYWIYYVISTIHADEGED